MNRFTRILFVGLLVVGISGVAFGQCPSTLEKINNSGVFTLGVRKDSPPFSFQGEGVGMRVILGDSTRPSPDTW